MAKVLVGTRQLQGQRKNDFCFLERENEPVGFVSECDGEPVDGRCGCRRAMVSLESGKTTTTMVVADIPDMTQERLAALLEAHLRRSGWVASGPLSGDDQRWIRQESRELLRIANVFAVGTILEKRGNKFANRIPKSAPRRQRPQNG